MRRFAICAGLLGMVAASAQADILLYGWNGDAEGWTSISRFATAPEVGVTEGTGAAVFNVTGWMNPGTGWMNFPSHEPFTNLVGNTVIKYDVTIIDPPAESWLNIWASIIFEGNIGGYFKTELPAERLAAGTVSFDYSEVAGGAITAGTPGSLSIQLMLNTAGGWTGGEVVIDNLRVETAVPEPVSIGVMALGSVLMLRRCRTI